MVLFAAREEEVRHCLLSYAIGIGRVKREVDETNGADEEVSTISLCCSCCGFLYDVSWYLYSMQGLGRQLGWSGIEAQ